jgi:DNA-binding beta-propeller fold protein YncE
MNLALGESAAPLLSNFNLPAGVNFDSLNQVFMVANSAENSVVLVNPTSFLINSFRVGIDPTTVDYDIQASTMLTVNSLTNTISVLDYDCPPANVPNGCTNPQVQTAVTGSSPQMWSSVVIGPNSLAIDPLLDLMVTVDPDNNRILLMPIPH